MINREVHMQSIGRQSIGKTEGECNEGGKEGRGAKGEERERRGGMRKGRKA